jgi:hypothetical protein
MIPYTHILGFGVIIHVSSIQRTLPLWRPSGSS